MKALLLALGIAAAIVLAVMAGLASATEPPVQEMDLNAAGDVYEANWDGHGNLFVSDYGAGKIWHIHPASGVYTVYQGLGSPSDAKADGLGHIWWTDPVDSALERLSLHTSSVTVWHLAGARGLLGLAIDDGGRVWATDAFGSQLYRFDPASNQVCTYTLPNGGGSDYVLYQAGELWLADWVNDRIAKFNPSTNLLSWWQLERRPQQSPFPQGLALDSHGRLWWADPGQGVLARLEPASNRQTTYTPPVGTKPQMVAVDRVSVWYTEIGSGTVGALNPLAASGVVTTLVPMSATVIPSCGDLGPGIGSSAVRTTHIVTWADAVYTPTVGGGWTVYQMPPGAVPWGIAIGGGRVWVADEGRLKLASLAAGSHVFLPLVRKE